jgi:acetyltransferase-like isoleucine patch superfamily enzyme
MRGLARLYHLLMGRPLPLPYTGGKACHMQGYINNLAGPQNVVLGESVRILAIITVAERGVLRVGDYTSMGRGTIWCAHEISIGRACTLADGFRIMDSDMHPRDPERRLDEARRRARGEPLDHYTGVAGAPVIIDDCVHIGSNAIICKGVHIGYGATIGAGAVVVRDVEAHCVVVGNPARPVRAVPASAALDGSLLIRTQYLESGLDA